MSVTTAIILDKRKNRMNKKTKCYPVSIRVTFERVPRAFDTGVEMAPEEFAKLGSPRLGEKLREIKEKLEKEEQRAKTIIKNLNRFSFAAFSDQFSAFQPFRRRRRAQGREEAGVGGLTEAAATGGKVSVPIKSDGERNFVNQFGKRKYPREKSAIDFPALGEVAVFYGQYIAKLEAKEQAGTVGIYMCSLVNLLAYKPQLRFADVTDVWLCKYEKDMRATGRSVTTIGIYLRCLRRIFNMVIAKRIIDRDLYPFGRDLYVIPAARKRKKALNMGQIKALFEYRSEDKIRQMCKDLWFFLYVANGMNVKDLCLLKFKQISGEFCRFIRAKTANTTKECPQEITFYCDDFILSVIAQWGNGDQSADNYIFPFLEPDMDGYAIRHKVQLVTHLINEHMKAIAEELGLDFVPKSNDARHAFATQLKRAGKSTEFIRELIGHERATTTQDYLDDFEDDTKKGISEQLLPFRKRPWGEEG